MNIKLEKKVFLYILILQAIAVVIGVYLIVTTVLISRDGVFYLLRAQQFGSDPSGVIRGHYFGLPFLVFLAHKFAGLFGAGDSVYTWA
ncbi:hypothetical protein KAR91_41350, partial [Candidatus Pacearchaeota archaeon]|nr:hypothetical protein [Candidatus Pacearchaeota archaeon]